MGRVVSLGEIMLRLSTNAGTRLSQTGQFDAYYGGSEANVAISLAHFGHESYFASKVPANALGDGAKKHLQSNGVDTSFLLRGGPRLGTCYTETGISERATSVIYDRANSSFSLMTGNDWGELFQNVDIFHISGITPALSPQWKELAIGLIRKAKESGCRISFDVNYRSKLWTQEECKQTLKKVLPLVDFCSAGKMDARYLLDIPEVKQDGDTILPYYQKMQERYPNITAFYSTKRTVKSASANELIGTFWSQESYVESRSYQITPIVDRIGGGYAFVAGILHGLLVKTNPQELIDFATAASVLKHTVYGDCNAFSEAEVKDFVKTGSGKINR